MDTKASKRAHLLLSRVRLPVRRVAAHPDRHLLPYALMIALGLVLDVTGALHVYGLSALMGQRLAAGAAALLVAIALGWLAVAAREPRTEACPEPKRRDREPRTGDQRTKNEEQTSGHAFRVTHSAAHSTQRFLAFLMLLAWIATARDVVLFLAPRAAVFERVLLAVGALGLALAVLRPPAPGWLAVMAALLGTVVRLVSFAHVPIEPPRGDMLPLVQGALGNLLAGRSPYTTYAMPWELPLTYLPATWLAYLPPSLLGLDIRLTNLAAELAIGATLAWLAARRRLRSGAARGALAAVWQAEPGLLLWAWVFLQPTALHWSLTTTAPVLWALLALLLALLVGARDRAAAIGLGLCVAASPLTGVVAPFVLLRWLRAWGWRRSLGLAAWATLIAVVFILPFLLWSPDQFIFGTLRWFNDNDLFPRLRWEMDHTWARMVGFSGIFWRHGLVGGLKPLQALLIAGLAVLYWRWGATAGRLAPFVTAALLLFTVFNPVLWPYLYNPALVAALVAIVEIATDQRPPIEQHSDLEGGRPGDTATMGPDGMFWLPIGVAFGLRGAPLHARTVSGRKRLGLALLLLVLLPGLTVSAPLRRTALSAYDPDLEALLLANGYEANIVRLRGLRGLRASQQAYRTSIWARDLDYAISGYSYAVADMTIFRESIELFLAGTMADGVVPETIWLDRLVAENRQSWDSMPNLIHAVYAYVAKTGDRAFYQRHRATLERVGMWIARLDSNDDGLPDRDSFPYGYYDSVGGGVMHTYALAKFYAAFCELAELERYDGRDGRAWERRAARLRAGFHRPFARGGYWIEGLAWPIAWRRPHGSTARFLETFGVFEALRSGLIGPSDGPRYRALMAALHASLPELSAGPTPMRLALGGYEPEMRRVVVPPVPIWMLDASAPWIVGIAAPAYAAAGYPDDAAALVQAYAVMARATDPPVLEFAAGPQARYGAGISGDRGRAWDNAAWFLAVYGGHYGITMTPSVLIVQPQPFVRRPSDAVYGLTYQGARVQLTLDVPSRTYRIQADRAIAVRLRPMGDAALLQVDGGELQTDALLTLMPGHEYVVLSTPGPRVDAFAPAAHAIR